MKTIYEVLVQVKANYLASKYLGETGLCAMPSREDHYIFYEYWMKYVEFGHTHFFTHTGESTRSNDQFAWKVGDIDSRIAWLDKHIKLNKEP